MNHQIKNNTNAPNFDPDQWDSEDKEQPATPLAQTDAYPINEDEWKEGAD